MELPARQNGDQLLKSGELVDIRRRLSAIAAKHDVATVIACAFDHRTRMLPFIVADVKMSPAGVRAIGSALVESGFEKTRVVLQQWNRNFRPSQMQIDGRLPDLFLASSMSLHTAEFRKMVQDVCRIEPSRRPLVIAGGSLCIYEPWEAFYTDPSGKDPSCIDLAVTGEEYVLLNLLEVLLSGRAGNEPLRQTFLKARDSGALDAIPGLIYPRTDTAGRVQELVDTGIQRLVGDLDELPFPTAGYSILETPSKAATLAPKPLPRREVRKFTPIGSLIMTFGCRFACEYCPIPAYNQRQLRYKSGERVAEEMHRIFGHYGIRHFFGTDDNFFNNKQRAIQVLETLAAKDHAGVPLHRRVRWGTEVTVHDTLQMREYLPLAHKAGVRALWLGVEDMTGALVRKGQGEDKTAEAFELLCENGIAPMPMMMHHDRQPLLSRGNASGLLNQVNRLRKAGAAGLQVLMLTPSAGSKSFESTFESGMVYKSVAGKEVQAHMYDGNHVIACNAKHPWQKQFNILAAYLFFYNLIWLPSALWKKRKTRLGYKPFGMQLLGMYGLMHTIRRTFGWGLRLMFGRIKRWEETPAGPFPMRSPQGGVAAHARGKWAQPPCEQTKAS